MDSGDPMASLDAAEISSAGIALKLHRHPMRRVSVGLRPRLFAFQQRGRIGQLLCHDQTLERREPAVVVPRSIVRFTARRIRLQFIGEYRSPFSPSEVPQLRELDGERKGLSL